jgi:cell division septation protein DedD
MLLFASAYAAEDNWVYVGDREDNLWFVNTDSITCKENVCRAWVKIQPLVERYEYTVGLNEYNCMEMKYKILRATRYDSNGNAIKIVSPTEQGWEHIVPESISKELCDFVCKKTSSQKEQQSTDEKDVEKVAEENLVRKGEAKKGVESAKQVQSKGAVLPKEIEAQSEKTEETKEKYLKPQKPSEAIFTVQVGAFSNASYAEALATWLKEKGYHVYTLLGSKEGKKLYKVCIGKFIEREKAKILSEKIKNSEGLQTFVTSAPF